jgi:putative MFS transporter
LGAVMGAYLGPVVGWRGLFALGAIPSVLIFPIRSWVPESPHWLVRVGRREEARASLAWALQMDAERVPLPEVPAREADRQPPRWSDLLRFRRSLAVSWFGNLAAQSGIYGLTLWVPTLFVQLFTISPAEASYLMIYCSAGGFVGRVAFSYWSEALGRRLSGAIYGVGAAALVVTAAYLHNVFIGTVSVFWLTLIAAYFFVDGGFALVGPYSAEVWPARLRATGMGSAYGFGGLGRIVGPLGLAMIIGSSDVVKPAASVAKIIPAFLYLGAWLLLAGIIFGVFGIETKGRSIEEIDEQLERERSQQQATAEETLPVKPVRLRNLP